MSASSTRQIYWVPSGLSRTAESTDAAPWQQSCRLKTQQYDCMEVSMVSRPSTGVESAQARVYSIYLPGWGSQHCPCSSVVTVPCSLVFECLCLSLTLFLFFMLILFQLMSLPLNPTVLFLYPARVIPVHAVVLLVYCAKTIAYIQLQFWYRIHVTANWRCTQKLGLSSCICTIIMMIGAICKCYFHSSGSY